MPYVVTALISRNGARVQSHVFRTKAQANAYAVQTALDRPGSNPRVKKV